jgi:hypothetical protein
MHIIDKPNAFIHRDGTASSCRKPLSSRYLMLRGPTCVCDLASSREGGRTIAVVHLNIRRRYLRLQNQELAEDYSQEYPDSGTKGENKARNWQLVWPTRDCRSMHCALIRGIFKSWRLLMLPHRKNSCECAFNWEANNRGNLQRHVGGWPNRDGDIICDNEHFTDESVFLARNLWNLTNNSLSREYYPKCYFEKEYASQLFWGKKGLGALTQGHYPYHILGYLGTVDYVIMG